MESAGSPPAGDEEPSAGSAGAGETARPRAEVGRGPARYYRHAETNGLNLLLFVVVINRDSVGTFLSRCPG